MHSSTPPTPPQAGSSTQTSSQTVQSSLQNALLLSPSIDASNKLSLALPNGTVLQQQLSMQLATQLGNQQLLAMIQGQQVALYSASAAKTLDVALNGGITSTLRKWLKSGSDLKFNNLPSQLQSLISTHLPQTKVKMQLLALRLIGHTLQLTTTEQSPLLLLNLAEKTQDTDAKAVTSLLQFSLPIIFGDDDAFAYVEQDTNKSPEDEKALSFKMRFDLKPLGTLELNIKLKHFTLEVASSASSKGLFTKVKQQWPILESRFEKLGFETSHSLVLQEQKSVTSPGYNNNRRLLDVKA